MNAYAALTIPSKQTLDERMEIILKQLKKVRAGVKEFRDRAEVAIMKPDVGKHG